MTRPPLVNINRRLFLGAAAATALLPAAASVGALPARASAQQAGGHGPAWHRFAIGDFKATIVSDGPLLLDNPLAQFPSAPEAEVVDLLEGEFLPTDVMRLEQNCLVVDTGSHLVLFDTGMGSSQMFGPKSGILMEMLASAGYSGDQFDAIVISHAHCDHCWGIMADDGSSNFPNAEIYISEADFDFWTDEEKLGVEGFVSVFVEGARRNLIPNREKVHFFADGEEFLPGIQAKFTPGHTVGHTSFLITSGGSTMLYVGDVVHHYVLLFRNPRWEFAFDTDPARAAEARVSLFEMASAERIPLIGYHFPFPGIGNIAPYGDGYRYIPTAMEFG